MGVLNHFLNRLKKKETVITPEETQKWKLSFCKSKLDT